MVGIGFLKVLRGYSGLLFMGLGLRDYYRGLTNENRAL